MSELHGVVPCARVLHVETVYINHHDIVLSDSILVM